MPGGEAQFRASHAGKAAKIDADPAIAAPLRTNVWAEIETWDGLGLIENHAVACFSRHQLEGPAVNLDADECLGTAQRRDGLTRSLSKQKPPRLPALTILEARTYLAAVEGEPDPAVALALFKGSFASLRLRSIRTGRRSARIFAFRNDASPGQPLGTPPLQALFDRLAIPDANAQDYTLLGYRPGQGDLVHQPNCFDANMWNLDAFVPGGLTAGGMAEVVTTPPRCSSVTQAPRRVV